CATFRSPHTLLCVPFFVIGAGRLRAPHSCCQAPNLPWAPVPPPHAAARPVICHGPPYQLPHAAAMPVICHGPLYRLPHAAARSRSVSWVPVRPPLLLSPSPHSAIATFRSPHLLLVVIHFGH
ncbi:unnamed protein product, partial [Staurois parvus]